MVEGLGCSGLFEREREREREREIELCKEAMSMTWVSRVSSCHIISSVTGLACPMMGRTV